MPLRCNTSQLTVVQAAMPADLHFTPDVHAQSIRELERVEERIRDHCRPLVRCFRFEESGISEMQVRNLS